MKTKKELTSLEKGILVAISVCIITFLLRVWNPSFLGWFHVSSMQESNFLVNIIQTIWFVFQVVLYVVTGVSALILAIFTIVGLLIIAIGVVPFIVDSFIAIWNILSRIIPIPHIDIQVTKSYFDLVKELGDIKFLKELGEYFPTARAIGFYGGLIIVFIYAIYHL